MCPFINRLFMDGHYLRLLAIIKSNKMMMPHNRNRYINVVIPEFSTVKAKIGQLNKPRAIPNKNE